LAINALELVDDYGTCETVSWFCDRDLPNLVISEGQL
jgi:hypothetical protein